ncbi:MAG: HupE/UreJ family protein [Segetibacter sp.]|nr:HupE/UreJ family protein [Segetibacter sp.]
MNSFGLYFALGRQHIADLNGVDHILFVTALCIRYLFADWKKLLLLITAFTIGHSITLALSVLNIIHFSTKWIEFLIPVTIIITAVSNLFVKKFAFKSKYPVIYFLAIFFGLIHGLGFSNYLKSLLGRGEFVVMKLLAFNIGLEIGQLLIVLAVLLLTFVCINLLKINRREYILFLSGGILGIAVNMALQRIPF